MKPIELQEICFNCKYWNRLHCCCINSISKKYHHGHTDWEDTCKEFEEKLG